MLQRASHADVTGSIDDDGTLTLQNVAEDGGDVRFHPATPEDSQRFYANATGTWQYREPAALPDAWSDGALPIGAVALQLWGFGRRNDRGAGTERRGAEPSLKPQRSRNMEQGK
jgi:hypothetical protein